MLAEPSSDDAGVRQHLATCQECTRYALQLRRFEGRLDRALRVEVNPRLMEQRVATPLRAARPHGARPWDPPHRRWLAAAASVLLGTAVAVSLWLAAPGRSLAADVVKHMAGEPYAWARTEIPVPQPRLDKVLIDAHVRFRPSAGHRDAEREADTRLEKVAPAEIQYVEVAHPIGLLCIKRSTRPLA